MKQLDYLIVGQGIAGSLLAYFLHKIGKSILVVDQFNPNSSSRVAAGIFNPITGRRFVKTWKADEIFPFVETTYRKLERETGQQFYFKKNIVRTISDNAEWKEWEKKSRRADYQQYVVPGLQYGEKIQIEIRKGGNVDLTVLLTAMREQFLEKGLLAETEFGYQDTVLTEDSVVWKDYEAKKVVFCEGIKSMQNPWFGHLPFTHAKGEILTIKSKSLKQNNILSKGIFVLPIGEDTYKVGSTYDWDDLSEVPTQKGRDELIQKLEKLIACDYEILHHQAGIRPTVKDRRPLIGLHPDFPQLGIFNGLGTKGASLAPFFARQFVEHLEDGKTIDPEADIKRFR